ncbi:MAG: YIP1 family protein [Caldilineales bacterium]
MEATSSDQKPLLSLLVGIVDRPRSTLAQVLAYPRWKWLAPAVLGLLAAVILLGVSAQLLADQAAQQQALALSRIQGQLDSMTEAQREQVMQQMQTFSSPVIVAVTAFVTRAIGLFIGWAIGTAILYFGLVIGGLEIGFGALFAGYSWTSLPFVVRDLADTAYIAISGTLRVNPGLSYFVASGDVIADARNPLWVLTGRLDLFFLWHLVLVYALIKAARPKSGALFLTLMYTLIYLALRVLPPLLATQMSFG